MAKSPRESLAWLLPRPFRPRVPLLLLPTMPRMEVVSLPLIGKSCWTCTMPKEPLMVGHAWWTDSSRQVKLIFCSYLQALNLWPGALNLKESPWPTPTSASLVIRKCRSCFNVSLDSFYSSPLRSLVGTAAMEKTWPTRLDTRTSSPPVSTNGTMKGTTTLVT